MSAFEQSPCSNILNYFRENAIKLGCNPNFDSKLDDLLTMNDEGKNGIPSCLCHIGVACPCKKWIKDSVTAERGTRCYCEVFVKL